MEHMRITQCALPDCALAGILTGNADSNTGIRDLKIQSCSFSSELSGRDPAVEVPGTRFAMILAAALQTSGHMDIRDTFLEDVEVSRCTIRGAAGKDYAEGIFFLGGYDFGYAVCDPSIYMAATRGRAVRTVLSGIHAFDNDIAGVYDGGLFAAGFSCGIGLEAGDRVYFKEILNVTALLYDHGTAD